MSNDKTLATAKHGGCVQLGKNDLSTSEGGRAFLRDFFVQRLRRHDFTTYITTRLAADFACALAQHLSTQSSLGGQDAARYERLFLSAVGMLTKISLRLGLEPNSDGVEPMLAAIDALAARQPVGEPVGHLYRVVVSEAGASREWRGAGVVFEQGPAPYEGVGRNIQYMNVYAAPTAQSLELARAKVKIAALELQLAVCEEPAQAVDLGQFRLRLS